jgi:SAM-dependent methyltransferase
MNTMHEYALGDSEAELARLQLQARLLEPMTRRFLLEAGLKAGMRVLDLGSGAGDVSLLIADIVTNSGSVVGLDRHPAATATACRRANELGIHNVQFVTTDIGTYMPDAPFDALVGRFVLMYQPDPVTALRQAAAHLRPGGVIGFMEPWFLPPQGPDTVTKRVLTCIVSTLYRSGAHVDLGPKLATVFAGAELPEPSLRFEAVIDAREQSPLYDYVAASLKTLLPKAIEYGLTQPGDFDVDKIAQQVGVEMRMAGYAMVVLPTIMAHCKRQN